MHATDKSAEIRGERKWSNTEGGRQRFVAEQSKLLSSLHATYCATDDLMRGFAELRVSTPADNEFEIAMQALKTCLIATAAEIKTEGMDGVHTKLLMWHRDDPDLPLNPVAMNRSQLLLVSLLRDIKEQCGAG